MVTPSWTEAVSGAMATEPTPETETVARVALATGVAASCAETGCPPAKSVVATRATAPSEASLRSENVCISN